MAQILLIDDDPQVLDVFQQFLEAAGHKLVTATDGQQGIDLYDPNTIDLVITDMVMPVKNGLKMIMELERSHPGVKIIAISGGGVIEPERYLSLAKSIGTEITLVKPVDREELLLAVNKALGVE